MEKRRQGRGLSLGGMASIDSITLEVADAEAARRFYDTAFGLGPELQLRGSDAPPTGFRGFTISLLVSQPADVEALIDAAVRAGATVLKPVRKSFWGFGGVVQAPDGTIWKVASSSKKNTRPASRSIDRIVVLLGVEDVAATKRFYVDHGVEVGKSFGRKYVEFTLPASAIQLGLYGRRALAEDAGVAPEGTGSHGIVIGGDIGASSDLDGFAWAPAMAAASSPAAPAAR
jgi:catechol 2,3-dioxygenase-like lactoylglutathione lyase family enzyme